MQYVLPLRAEKVKPHQVTTLHLVCAFGFTGTGAIIMVYNYTIPYWGTAIFLFGLLLLSLTIFKNKWLTSPKVNPAVRFSELLVALFFLIYSVWMQWKFPITLYAILSAGLAFALFWERKTGNTLQIVVDDEGLRLPVVRRRFVPWTELEQVTLRFGAITINCLDNHFFQWTIRDKDVDAAAFNNYCSLKITENIPNRRNDEW